DNPLNAIDAVCHGLERAAGHLNETNLVDVVLLCYGLVRVFLNERVEQWSMCEKREVPVENFATEEHAVRLAHQGQREHAKLLVVRACFRVNLRDMLFPHALS